MSTLMNTLLISIAAIAVYLIFDFVRDILRTKRIFESMIASGEELLIDFDDCSNISDMIALHIVKVRNF